MIHPMSDFRVILENVEFWKEGEREDEDGMERSEEFVRVIDSNVDERRCRVVSDDEKRNMSGVEDATLVIFLALMCMIATVVAAPRTQGSGGWFKTTGVVRVTENLVSVSLAAVI